MFYFLGRRKKMKITVKEFIELMRAEKILWQISDERMLNGDIEFQDE